MIAKAPLGRLTKVEIREAVLAFSVSVVLAFFEFVTFTPECSSLGDPVPNLSICH